MKKIWTVLLCIAIGSACFGQNTFTKVYRTGLHPASIVNFDYGNKYIFWGQYSLGFYSGLYIVNLSGDWTINHSFNGLFINRGHLTYINNNSFLLSGMELWTGHPAPSSLTVLRTDTTGQIFWKYALDVYFNRLANSLQLADGRIMCSGNTAGNFNSDVHPFVLVLDSTGNVHWYKTYNIYYGKMQFIYSFNNEVYLGINSDSLGAAIAKIDTAGNVLWCKSLVRPKGYLQSIAGNADGTFLLTGNVDSAITLPENQKKLFIIKMDSTGGVMWGKTYGDTLNSFPYANDTLAYPDFSSRVRAVNDGGYILANTLYNESRNDYNLLLIKTDSSGNILWSRNHGAVGKSESGGDIIQTNDNGYFVVGNTVNLTPGTGYYVLKTDSLGETATHCLEYTDTISINNLIVNDSIVVLSSNSQTVNVYSSAVYDTTYNPSFIYDGCLLSSIQYQREDMYNKHFAYPNPNSGKFSISGVQKKKYDITVYDNMGKVVLQKTETSEIPPQLDLSKQPKGVYHVRINEGGKVSVSRVVVQ